MQPNSSHHYYRVTQGVDGSDKLERVTFNEFNEALLTELNGTVQAFVKKENAHVFQRIAAGTAVKHVFAAKSYRRLGLTKEGYCRAFFDRDPSTVNSYVEAATAYDEIGGIESTVQPTSVHQLDMLAAVKPGLRRTVWADATERNNGQPPPADLIFLVADGAKAWIERKKKQTVPERPELPCGTLEEAISFVTHCQGLRKAGPRHWAKVQQFLVSLRQQRAQPVRVTKGRNGKAKAIPDVAGQTLMFEEQLVPTKTQ